MLKALKKSPKALILIVPLVLNGGLSGTNLTLWGFLENPRTFETQSGQEKRALKGSFSKNGGG